MTEKNYKLLDAVNRSGIDNTKWGLCHDVNIMALTTLSGDYAMM